MSNRLRLNTTMSLGGLSPRQLAVGMWKRMEDHDSMTWAAAVAFYAMLATVLFRLYVQQFGGYTSLGALGGVMVLLFWFWAVALVLLGAAEMDRTIEAGSPIGRTPAGS